MIWLRSSLVLLIFLTLITGLLYPLLITGISVTLFPDKAAGSLIEQDGKLIGSALIGQEFTGTGYFHGRPSMTAEHPYNAMSSGGSNLAPTNPDLLHEIQQRAITLRLFNFPKDESIPVDLATASGSGLDPHISPDAAEFQAERIAKARHLPVATVNKLIRDNTESPSLYYIGQPVVNVLKLNLALDHLKVADHTKTGGQ
ncbi:MAG: potassium-transporting ATPase subunit KdpC [Enterobacteriaceae bacterium]|jgi:K+-transporting ATPase ATPase C chain|nr:potassium-transporting ATPase subunit KdpC [Enterobacteriaceae bacterium]